MKKIGFAIGLLTALTITVSATVRYVDVNGTNAVSPYSDWTTAATNIQDAVDAAVDGDQILVTNGVYRTRSRAVYGTLLYNRVVVNKAVTVQSVNGPEVTFIEGRAFVSPTAVRCVYLTNNAALIGFTLTNGSTLTTGTTNYDRAGGGVWCESTNVLVSNCVMTANSAYWLGAGAYSGTLRNCTINNNTNFSGTAGGGGAVNASSLFDSTISSNYNPASGIGGAMDCTLSNCLVTANVRTGARNSTLYDCVVAGNSNSGMWGGIAYSCIVSNNDGGAYLATLNNCLICGNQSSRAGGGVGDCTLNFCVVSNNMSTREGGGEYFSSSSESMSIAPGVSNIIVGNTSARGGGCYFAASGKSLTNWVFLNNWSAGDGGGLFWTGGNQVLANCTFTSNSAAGDGGGMISWGSSGSRAVCSNCTFIGNTAGSNGGGTYNVVLKNCLLTSNNAQNGGGVADGNMTDCIVTGNIAVANGGALYGSASVSGYLSNLNSTISDNSAGNGGGVYSTKGYYASNCTIVRNSALTNGGGVFGAGSTFLDSCSITGNLALNCGGGVIGVANSSPLTVGNCSISENLAMNSGGGVYHAFQTAFITNCWLANNSAGINGGGVCGPGPYQLAQVLGCVLTNNSSGDGGGVYGSTLKACLITGNRATNNGGGAYNSSLTQCTLSGNRATDGGGVHSSTSIECLVTGNTANNGGGGYGATFNCSTVVGNTATNAGGGAFFPASPALTMRSSILYYNFASSGSEYSGSATFYNCCTTPAPQGGGSMNITNAPAFIDLPNGNLRLQSNSPCISWGTTVTGLPTVDLDGRPRQVGIIDIGAYEYQGPGIGEFTAWLLQHGLPANGSADLKDTDGDGLNNWQEWMSGTVPTNALSILKMLYPSDNGSGLDVTWQSVTNRTYYLERSTDLAGQPAFSSLQSNIVGQAGTTTYTDTSDTSGGLYIYRVGVQQE